MAGPDDLFAAASEYLDLCVEALATTDAGPPPRAYVCMGSPAVDCEQLTVHLPGEATGDTAPTTPPMQPAQRSHVGVVWFATLVASVFRCQPVPDAQGNPPAAAELEAAAVVGFADAWAILNHIRTRHEQGTFLAPRERELFLDPVVAVGPLGGYGGFELQIRVQLDGYIPEGT